MRKIAALAEVNIAAVNYHFSNKENLLKLAMQATLRESFVNNINDYEQLWQTDSRQALTFFLRDTLQGAINYPNLIKAHFQKVFNNNDYNSFSVHSLNEFLQQFHSLIKSELRDEQNSKIATCQLFSAILLIGMMPDIFSSFLSSDIKSEAGREDFLQTLLNTYLK